MQFKWLLIEGRPLFESDGNHPDILAKPVMCPSSHFVQGSRLLLCGDALVLVFWPCALIGCLANEATAKFVLRV